MGARVVKVSVIEPGARGRGHARTLMRLSNVFRIAAVGHYIAPHEEHGFGYLDAVREVLTHAPKEHADLRPEDAGLGPCNSLFRAARAG